MKGKRQTIWLVSMLSLMVVLSAYYLFTEDSGSSIPQETAGSIQVDGGNSGSGAETALDSGLVINEVVTGDTAGESVDTAAGNTGDTAADPAALTEDATGSEDPDKNADTAKADTSAAGKQQDAAAADKAASAGQDKTTQKDTSTAGKNDETSSAAAETAKSDDEILKEVATQSVSASALINDYLLEREQKNLKNYNDLLAQINDMDKTPAENAVAQEQLNQLEDRESKIHGIEEQLQQKYGQAIVKEESGDSYTVVVLSNKLDVKQAVGIVDLVMKELSVAQNQIKVQYVSEQ